MWMSHVPMWEDDQSRSCDRDSSSCKGAGVPVPLPRSNPPQRVAASGDTGDLRITVSAFPSGNQPPRKPHSSCTPQPAELPEERGGPSQRCAPSVSFGAPLDDRMSIAASEGECYGP